MWFRREKPVKPLEVTRCGRLYAAYGKLQSAYEYIAERRMLEFDTLDLLYAKTGDVRDAITAEARYPDLPNPFISAENEQ